MKDSKSGVMLPTINPVAEKYLLHRLCRKGNTAAGCEKVNGMDMYVAQI